MDNDCVLTYCYDLTLLSFVKFNINKFAADYIHFCFTVNLYISTCFYWVKLWSRDNFFPLVRVTLRSNLAHKQHR